MKGYLNGLDLFSGIGGISYGLNQWVQPKCYVEINGYCQNLLKQRMQDGQLGVAPIWDDIRSFDGIQWKSKIDIIYGGFPCQDLSSAGNGKGLEGERSGLFFEVVRLAKEIQPTFIFLENVPGIRKLGLDVVGKELANLGYDSRWCTLSAYDVGAPHKRERWFVLAYSNGNRCLRENPHVFGGENGTVSSGCSNFVGGRNLPGGTEIGGNGVQCDFADLRVYQGPKENFWETQSGICRVADGISNRVDRLHALGNGVVPQQVKEAFVRLMGLKT